MTEVIKTIIKFDGPALAGKAMDVSDLAPSLIALSELLKEANRQFNGDKVGLKILVNADVQQNCFELGVELVQTVWNQVASLIDDDKVKTAKEIAEWVGIICDTTGKTMTAAGGAKGLFQLLKILKGQKVKDATFIKQQDGASSVQINIVGNNNNVVVSPEVYALYANHKTRRKAAEVLQPLNKEGYENLQFYKGKHIFQSFTKKDVPTAEEDDYPEIISTNMNVAKIRTFVRIRKAAYEGKSKWTLVYRSAIEATIDDEKWLTKFQLAEEDAPPGSSLDVDLEETSILNDRGEAIEEPIYRVVKVHNIIKPATQLDLLKKNEPKRRSKKK